MRYRSSLSSFLRIGLSGLLLVTITCLGALSWVLLHYEQQNSQLRTQNSLAIASSSLLANGLQMGQATRNIILDPSNATAYKNYEESEKAFRELLDQMSALDESISSRQRFDDALKAIRNELEKDVVLQQAIHQVAMSRETERAIQALNREETPQWRKYRSMMIEMRKQMQDEVAKGQAIADRMTSSMHIILAAICIFVITTVIFVLFGTFRLLSKAHSRLCAVLQASEQSSAAIQEVSSVSLSLSKGASEQAAAIEETSSSLEEMSSMTKQNSDNARQADQLMASTKESVYRSAQIMDKLTTSMGEISKASEETSKIIKTIDEIAFQTNLLALNAAVEAARAGEAGAGFAIVADEVGNLAMRAAEAAKNTGNLIEGTVKKIKEGSELVQKTDAEFRQVALNVEQSGELVGQISAASAEQSQGIEQINKAVSEMDKVVQQNAGNAEESASASEEMNSQAKRMKNLVEDLVTVVGARSSRRAKRFSHQSKKKEKYDDGLLDVHVGKPVNVKSASKINSNGSMHPRSGGSARPNKLIPFDEEKLMNF